MRPSDLALALEALIPTRRAVYLWSGPGTGKSSLVHQACRRLDLKVLDLRAVLLDPVDLRGLPVPNGEAVHWKPPAFLPRKGADNGKGVIFCDELAQAPGQTQAAFLQGILDHQIGETQLDPNWTWVAASNRQEDRAGVHRLISPLLNRFIHLDLDVSNEDWQAWAAHTGIAAEVRSFLNFRPALLFDFKPDNGDRAFPTPRSWHMVSDVLPTTPDVLVQPVVAGCVGDGPAAEFVAFLQTYRELPDVDALLKNPDKAKVPAKPAVLYALCGAVAERCRHGEAELRNSAVKYMLRLPDEFAILAMKDAIHCTVDKKRSSPMTEVPACNDFTRKHRELLVQVRV